MIQKKVCLVGVFGAGKTCLVQQFVYSKFSAKYHSTVGVKIDRKEVTVGGTGITLLIWDLAGRDAHQDISVSYLRGAHAILYVVDGTRRETFTQVFELKDIAEKAVGPLPGCIALNKADLEEQWILGPADDRQLAALGWHALRTSARTGQGVEEAFHWIAEHAK